MPSKTLSFVKTAPVDAPIKPAKLTAAEKKAAKKAEREAIKAALLARVTAMKEALVDTLDSVDVANMTVRQKVQAMHDAGFKHAYMAATNKKTTDPLHVEQYAMIMDTIAGRLFALHPEWEAIAAIPATGEGKRSEAQAAEFKKFGQAAGAYKDRIKKDLADIEGIVKPLPKPKGAKGTLPVIDPETGADTEPKDTAVKTWYDKFSRDADNAYSAAQNGFLVREERTALLAKLDLVMAEVRQALKADEVERAETKARTGGKVITQ